jgi:hypothetical protein
LARVQKAGVNHRNRGRNRTQSKADALAVLVQPIDPKIVARKMTHTYGEVRVEVTGGRVAVVAGPDTLPMANEESAMMWLDNL